MKLVEFVDEMLTIHNAHCYDDSVFYKGDTDTYGSFKESVLKLLKKYEEGKK